MMILLYDTKFVVRSTVRSVKLDMETLISISVKPNAYIVGHRLGVFFGEMLRISSSGMYTPLSPAAFTF